MFSGGTIATLPAIDLMLIVQICEENTVRVKLHYNVQQKCISMLNPWYFTLLPDISLTALTIYLVGILADITMTFAASRNTLDSLLLTKTLKRATVPLTVAADKLQRTVRCDGVC